MKSITLLKFKVESCDADLDYIASFCRKATNVAIEDWLLRQRGKPESKRQSERLIKRAGANGKPKAESTKLYHAIRESVPNLGTTQASMIAARCQQQLAAKVDWRRRDKDGKTRKRRDAIIDYEDRPPFTTAMMIPLHNRQTYPRFTDKASIRVHRVMDDVEDFIATLSLREMPPGKQTILREIVNGERKLCDSQLINRDGTWYWHVPVQFETEIISEREAHLWPTIGADDKAGQADRPFRLDLPEVPKPYYVGDGRYLVAQLARRIGQRKMIGHQYRQRNGAGHGRGKFDLAVKARRYQERCIRTEVLRRAIASVVRKCVSSRVGTVVYHEPTLPARSKSWFTSAGITWDWTRWASDLRNAAARQGIEVKTVRYRIKEVLDDAKEREAAVSV